MFKFEKWRAIPASVDGMGGVLPWVALVACLRGLRDSVGRVGGVLAWVACQHGWRGWCANLGCMLLLLLMLLLEYYPEEKNVKR